MKYFNSFPHLVTFPANFENSQENLEAFSRFQALDEQGNLSLPCMAPIGNAMTPAPCYHLYPMFEGQNLKSPVFLSTKNFVFRRQAYFLPLRRQWCFTAREIVCIGTDKEVKAFLADMEVRWNTFFANVGLPVEWKQAQNPFFNPDKNSNSILQKLDPVKKEGKRSPAL